MYRGISNNNKHQYNNINNSKIIILNISIISGIIGYIENNHNDENTSISILRKEQKTKGISFNNK